MDIRCPQCNMPLVKSFDGPAGAQAEGYCHKCRLEVLVKRRPVVGMKITDRYVSAPH